MPFREVSVMDQKREFVVFAVTEGANIRELCRRFGMGAGTAASRAAGPGLSAVAGI
jgi:hypothetical protein